MRKKFYVKNFLRTKIKFGWQPVFCLNGFRRARICLTGSGGPVLASLMDSRAPYGNGLIDLLLYGPVSG